MKIQFEHQGKLFEAEAQNVAGTMWIHFQGRTFVYESESQKRRARSASSGAAKGDILSPMPGKVTKILKVQGELVAAGDAILVMEAMKMEYTLKAERAGVVSSMTCAIGEQVSLGKKLAHVDEVKA